MMVVPAYEGAASAASLIKEPISPMAMTEEQLERIIAGAREIAIVAEELLREISIIDETGASPINGTLSQALAVAPRLLASSEQQLRSLLGLLRNA